MDRERQPVRTSWSEVLDIVRGRAQLPRTAELRPSVEVSFDLGLDDRVLDLASEVATRRQGSLVALSTDLTAVPASAIHHGPLIAVLDPVFLGLPADGVLLDVDALPPEGNPSLLLEQALSLVALLPDSGDG